MSRAAPQAGPLQAPRRETIEDFLIEEAALLDDRQWDAWNALFTEDGLYWVPAALDQTEPWTHVSLQFEDALLRKVRIKRFDAPDAYSLQPFPRSSHIVSNVRLQSFDAETGLCEVRSKFIMLQFQRDVTTPFGGTYRHTLLWDGAAFRIKQKRVDLINCDGTLECINLYF